jgi:uracil-DNA glycosylase
MTTPLSSCWREILVDEWTLPYMQQLRIFLNAERARGVPIYPSHDQVFSSLLCTPYDQVKVVIIGQDPYHGPGQAYGLAFGVPKNVPIPPSLRNIFQELKSDLGIQPPTHGCLLSWAKQGVLLLNATLTVEDGRARSHYGKGWERFTDAIVTRLGRRKTPTVFLLWGRSAQEKIGHIHEVKDNPRHLILTAPHPSPLSAHQGFFGCRHFSKSNAFLRQHGIEPINWVIPE